VTAAAVNERFAREDLYTGPFKNDVVMALPAFDHARFCLVRHRSSAPHEYRTPAVRG